jgi:sensor c-di-GMP phosphodiesterase-like protein
MTVAYGVAFAMQFRSARAHLRNYATRLEELSDRISAENAAAVASVSQDNQEFCSDLELIFMRNYVFHAPHIRDLGRTRDGNLYCTSGVGRLDPPVPTGAPDIVSSGVKLQREVPLVFSDGTVGVVTERDGVSIVFNPDLLKSLEEPPMHYSAMYFDQNQKHMLAVYGPDGPLTIAEVLAAKPIDKDGVLYQPVCSSNKSRCAVAYESIRDIRAAGVSSMRLSILDGGLLGTALGVLLALVYSRQRSMESQLRRALRQGSLTVVYQPIVYLATGAIVAAEALVRWVDEDGVSIRPDVFVALAEHRGFTREITQLVVGCAAEELADMLAGNFRVTINMAPADLTDPAFIKHLDQCLSTAGVDPAKMILEITERTVSDRESAVAAIAKLRERGHGVFIDDFGAGYSNLALLHRLAIDGIKIDRAFTQTVGTMDTGSSVVPQILDMAKQLDLLVVVEGIETEAQAEYFRRAGRGILGQGWLFGRPVPAAQLRMLLLPD